MPKSVELADKVKAAWVAACNHEGLDPNCKFAILSDDNPHAEEHDEAMREFMAARQAEVNQRPQFVML